MYAACKKDLLNLGLSSTRFPDPFYPLARSYNPAIARFTSMDDIYVKPGDTENANLYAYVAGNPVNASDPSGHFDLGQLLIGMGISAIGATLGVGFNGVANYSRNLPFFANAGSAAAFGAVALPLSILFPPVGAALAGLGVGASLANAYVVLTNPNSRWKQDGAAVFLVAASAFSFRYSLVRAQKLGWYAALGPKPPTVSPIVLTRQSLMSELLPQVPDSARIHLSPVRAPNLVGGAVRAGESWVRFGDVKNLTFEEFQTRVVGPNAQASGGAADTVHIAMSGNGSFTEVPPGYISNIPEFTNDGGVAPDASVIINFN